MTLSGSFPWLSVVTFVPAAAAIVLAFFPRRATVAIKWFTLVVTLVTLGLALCMYSVYRPGVAGFQLVDRAVWVSSLDFNYILGVDGISVFMVLLTAFIMPLAILASWKLRDRAKPYMIAMLLLETATIGSFLALDLLLFFFFFEGLLFPMYLIVGAYGGERRVYAALKFFLYTMAGSALLLIAILFLYFTAGSQLGHPTFDLSQLQRLHLSPDTARWLFLAFLAAFAVKMPIFPVHTWQPDAYTEAPIAGTLILVALLAKVGAYGLIRFNLSLFPAASGYFRTFVLVLAALSIVYGAIVAIIQTDVKRLIAYSSISHLGFIVMGIFAFSLQAMQGSVLYMVNHALTTGALFLVAGMVIERIRTRDMDRMGGLAVRIPIIAGVFLFVALASIGLPGLNNFVSEFLVLLGTYSTAKGFAIAGVTALVFSVVYMLWAYQRMMHGRPAIAGGAQVEGEVEGEGEGEGGGGGGGARVGAISRLRDLTAREYLIVAPLMAAILFLGLYPKPILSVVQPAATKSVECVQAATGVGLNGGPATYAGRAVPRSVALRACQSDDRGGS